MLKTALFSLSLPLASAWWCDGHMLVAKVAELSMCQNVLHEVTPLVKLMSTFFPQSTSFVEAACWQDDIKKSNHLYDSWHFINYPHVANDPPKNPIPGVGGRDDHHVTWALEGVTKTLNSSDAASIERAHALFSMIHFVGDVHQPLHAATLYSSKYEPPVGDQGGNLFPIKGANQSELHAFWDSGAGLWEDDLDRPLNAAAEFWMVDWANKVMSQYPRSTLLPFKGKPASRDRFDYWARESFSYAANTSYMTKENATLTWDYIDEARDVCQQRVAWGGYRLANLLESVFGCE